ncbi:MAG TPA: hypothetical protein VM818_02420, partial [Vicinamibacterales bacterium]|nr:hypothetical protein [Vicinamibacterales bacterium]
MRALISPDLLRKLTARDIEIRDTKITGFLIRCRASGVHTYRYNAGRGQSVTLGLVGVLPVAEARAAAETQQTLLSRDTLNRLGQDETLTARDAKAQARRALGAKRGKRRHTWQTFVNEYETLATADMKSAPETLRRLRTGFAWFDGTP